MSKNLLFIILISMSQVLFAQFQDWESITNMNDIQDITIIDNSIWAVSNGGAYTYNISTQEIQKWTNINGLKSVTLKAIEKDNHANIVFGSKDGFIQVYNQNSHAWSTLSFEGLEVNDLQIMDDTLWVATQNKDIPGKTIAAFIWRNGNYEFNDFFVNFPATITSINKIALFNKRVWLATDVGILSASSDFTTITLSDPQNWTLYTIDHGLPNNNVLSFSVIDDKLWFGTSDGLAYISNTNAIVNTGLFATKSITHLNKDGNELLVVSNNQLFHYLHGSGVQNSSNFTKNISTLTVDENNIVWLGLQKGGLRNSETNFSLTLEGPLENHVRFIIRDDNDRIWTSTGKFKLTPSEGFSLYQNGNWTGYNYNGSGWGGLGNTNYIYQDRFGNVWLATWGGGVAVFNGIEYKYFHNNEKTGTLIVSTKDTLTLSTLNPVTSEYQGFFSPDGDPEVDTEIITAFKEDASGRLWIVNSYASNGNYLAVAPYNTNGFLDLDPEKWIYFGSKNGLVKSDGISSIDFDDFGRVWIGTNGHGVYVLDYNNTLTDSTDDAVFWDRSINDALISQKITSIAKDNDGIIWIGTQAGIHSFDGVNTFRHFGESGPISDAINQVVVDEFNNKWIATAGGLSILRGGFSPFETDAWIDYTTENSGLLSNSVNGIYIDKKNSEALVATESGLSIFSGSFAETQQTFDNVEAGPNPFLLGGENQFFIIKKLKHNSNVKIFDINGNLIRKLNTKNKQVDGSRATWNGKDINNNSVASGIYLYLAFTEDGKSVAGKIAVVRK